MTVVEALSRLNSSFRRSKLANADSILTDLRLLHRKGCKVPFRYYLESVKIFAFRRDVLRTELLLRMSQRNLVKPVLSDSDLVGNRRSRKSTRSRPHHDSYQKLVSFAVSGLIRSGAIEESMALWVRMSYGSNNYVTNRIGLEKIIEKVASGPNAIASLDLIEDMHQMMKFNRWDQRIGQRGHYNSMLKVMRKYLGSYIATDSTEPGSIIEEAELRLSQLDAYWADIETAGYLNSDNSSSHGVALELQALRLQALVNLGAEVWRALRQGNPNSNSSYDESDTAAEETTLSAAKRREEEFVAALQNTIATGLHGLVRRFHQAGEEATASEAKVIELVRRITGAETGRSDRNDGSASLDSLRSLLYEEPPAGPGAEEGQARQEGLRLTSRPTSAAGNATSASRSGDTKGLAQPLNPHHSAANNAGHKEARKSIRGALIFLATHGRCLDGGDGDGDGDGKGEGVNSKSDSMRGAVSLFADLLSRNGNARGRGSDGGLELTQKWISATASGILSAFSRHSQDEAELQKVTTALGAVLKANAVSPYRLHCQSFVLLSSVSNATGTGTTAMLQELERRGLDLLDHAGASPHSDDEHTERAAGYNAMVLALCNVATNRSLGPTMGSDTGTGTGTAAGAPAGAGAGAEAVSRAVEVVLEMIGNGHAVAVPTWIALLRSACATSSEEQTVLRVLRLCERSFNSSGSGGASSSSSSPNGPPLSSSEEPNELSLARLFAYAHIRRGFDCLEILRQMRPRPSPRGGQRLRSNHGVISFVDDADPDSGGGRQARGRHIYHRVISALYHARPARDHDWTVARNPANAADFLLREMHRDGVAASPATVTLLLSLFSKAASIASNSKSGIDGGKARAEHYLHKALEFVDHCSSIGGHKGHRPIPVTSPAVRELVRTCCVAGLEDQAVAMLTGGVGSSAGEGGDGDGDGVTNGNDSTMGSRLSALRSPLTGARITGTAGADTSSMMGGADIDREASLPGFRTAAADPSCWEPLVYYFAAVRGAEVAAEDALTLMLNMGLAPTPRIADACIMGLLRQPGADMVDGESVTESVTEAEVVGANVGDVVTNGYEAMPMPPGRVAISEAIDKAQDFFNQHSVRPSLEVLRSIRRLTEEAGDSYETERCDQVIAYLYGTGSDPL